MKIEVSKKLLAADIGIEGLGGASSKVNTITTGSELQNGAWLGQWPTSESISDFQKAQGKKMDYINMFIDFSRNFSSFKENVDAVYNNGSQLILTWEPQGITTDAISNGTKDSYICKMASELKAYDKPMIIRLMHEVNSNWYSWATGYQNGNTYYYWSYKSAYQYIVNIFRSIGATKVKFMYNINHFNVGNNTSYTEAYPGNDYVDILSIDGYNWGTTQSWGSTWQSFDQIFSSAYDALKGYNKSIFIAEVASAEKGGDKAAWIIDAFNRIRSGSYPLIDAIIWFNENKETDWRTNSTSSALAAYKAGITGV
jgi:beta-mannanase